VTVSPSGVMYMQPDGRVTTDGAGNTSSKFTVSVSGEDNITVQGETGYVE
jgi:MSHA pilin protein MshC